jgi:fermentation-respiration switch protein FrsA (DUF1100 family)
MTVTLRPVSELAAEPLDDPHYLPADPADLLVADPGRREPVGFDADGVTLAGHLYRPAALPISTPVPGIVMCGPFSSVKEQTVPHYAERLADAGYLVLTFDPRGFGESGGEPRFHHDPNLVVADYAHALSYLRGLDEVATESIGAVGVCMGGGYAMSLAARDKRIKAVASVAGGYDIGGTFQRLMGAEGFAAYQRTINDLVADAARSGQVAYMPTVSAEGLSESVPVAAMPNPEAASYYLRTAAADAPRWSNTMTVGSLETFLTYNAVTHASLVDPTPLHIIHGTRDEFLLPEFAQAAYEAASGPKALTWIETHNHIELYDQDPYVSQAVGVLVPWLDGRLKHPRR